MNIFKIKKNIVNALTHVILIAVSLTCLFPVFWMLSSSLKTQEQIFAEITLLPETWNWSNYITAFVKADFGQYFLNSVFYTVVGVFFVVLISSLAAYAFARLEFFGKHVFFYILIATLLIQIGRAHV